MREHTLSNTVWSHLRGAWSRRVRLNTRVTPSARTTPKAAAQGPRRADLELAPANIWVTETALATALDMGLMSEMLSIFTIRGRHRVAADWPGHPGVSCSEGGGTSRPEPSYLRSHRRPRNGAGAELRAECLRRFRIPPMGTQPRIVTLMTPSSSGDKMAVRDISRRRLVPEPLPD